MLKEFGSKTKTKLGKNFKNLFPGRKIKGDPIREELDKGTSLKPNNT